MEFINENQICKTEFDPQTGIIHNKWTGLMSVDLLKQTFQAIMDWQGKRENNLIKAVLNDAIEFRGTFTQANSWMNEVMLPYMQARGLRCYAISTSNVFISFAGNILISLSNKNGVQGKIFSSNEDAKKWINDIISK